MTWTTNDELDSTTLRGSLLMIDDDEPMSPSPIVQAEAPREPQETAQEDEPSPDSHLTVYGVERLNEPLTGPGATERARKRFGLPEVYRKAAAPHPVTGEPIPGTYFVMDEHDNIVVPKSVSEQYTPIQNSEMDVLDHLLEEEGLALCSGGLWKDGGIPWLFGKSRNYLTGPQGERIEQGALIKNPQGGLGPFEVVFTDKNLSCMNQWGAINRQAKHRFKCRHTKSASIKLETLRKVLSQRGEHRQAVLDYVFSMARKTLTNQAATDLAKLSLGIDLDAKVRDIPTKSANRLEKFLDIYEHGRAASPGTCYGFVQAATNWSSHQYSKATGLEGMETTQAGRWQSNALRHLEAYADGQEDTVKVYVGN